MSDEIDDIKDEIEYLKSDIKELKSAIEEIKDQINDLNDIYASKFKRLKESVSTPAPAPPVEKKKIVPYFFLISKCKLPKDADKKKLYLKINIAQMTSLLRPCYKSELEHQFHYKEDIENAENLYQDLKNFLYFTKKVNKDEIEMLNKKITLLKTSENEFKALLDEFFKEKYLSK